MAIVIREATDRDYEDLCTIIEEVDRLHREALPHLFRAPGGPARERNYILNAITARDVGLFVAEVDGQLAGVVHIIVRYVPAVPILVPRCYAAVDSLAVERAHRRGGVGGALMKRAETWARAKGATSIELNVYAFNQAAQAFYRKLGYETLSHHLCKSLETTESERREG